MMIHLVLLFTAALISGQTIEIDDQSVCIPIGYIAGLDFGLDCCSYIACDHTRLNKTGFIGVCMGGTAWNDDLKVCDDPKYVPDCNPADCEVPKRTSTPCSGPQPTETTCCIGQNPDKGFFGYEPVFTSGSNASGYFVGSDVDINLESFCPFHEKFVLETCCCEVDYSEYFLDPICESDLETFYFTNPDDPCCSFVRCFYNRTDYEILNCMGGSVWNSVNQTCDTVYNVMECMDVFCDNYLTDPPCDADFFSGSGDCCRAGTWYSANDDPTIYEIVAGQGKGPGDRLSCCPVNMDGEQLVFNASPEICSCEVLVDI